jgi:hypothetical protein
MKMKKSKRSTLAEVMLGNDDLTTDSVARRAVAPVINETRYGNDQPELSEAVTAMLIMAGCTATWNVGFWIVQGNRGMRCHVSARNDFEEWRESLNRLVGGGFGVK